MDIKFVKFLILAIVAGLVLPNFTNLCWASENTECYEKFVDDPLFAHFDTVLKRIFEVLRSVQPDISSLEIPKHECISYSLTQKAVDGISSAFDVINEKNCSAVHEIEKLGEEAISAAVSSTKNVYVTIRNLSESYAEFGKYIDETENNAVNHISTAFRCFFNEIKIVLAEICPDNQLVKVDKNALELLKAENDEAVSKITDLIDETVNLSADIHTSYLKLHQSDAKDNSSLFEADREKALAAFTEIFQYIYELLKNFLPYQKEA